jgi:hypothetical protein
MLPAIMGSRTTTGNERTTFFWHSTLDFHLFLQRKTWYMTKVTMSFHQSGYDAEKVLHLYELKMQ